MKFKDVLLFSIGWVLSPFTWWNDVFINLPISYIISSLLNKIIPEFFLSTFLIAYWFTNILGIFLMFLGSKELLLEHFRQRKILLLIAEIAIYSLIIWLSAAFKIIGPIRF